MGDDFNFEGVQFLEGDELFGGEPAAPEQPKQEPEGTKPEGNKTNTEQEPTEVYVGENDDLFGDSQEPQEPESVGEEGNNKDGKKAATNNGNGDSPKDNVYSSFAKALKGDGLFQFLEDEVIDKISDGNSFADAFEQEVNARLDEETRRVKEALDAGVSGDTVKQYQNIMGRLGSITEESISEESEQASNLRQNLIYQDYINRGFSKERALREVKRSTEGGTDIEDAKEALESNKQFYKDKYDELVAEGRERIEEQRKRVRQETEDFKKEILNKEKLFGSIEVDKAARQKAFDAMTRVVDHDEDGSPRTVVQKFADENPVQFRTVLGLMWSLTDGFKDLGKLIQGNIDKKVRSNLKAIEERIAGSTPRGGSPRFLGGEDEPDNKPKPGSWRFDI